MSRRPMKGSRWYQVSLAKGREGRLLGVQLGVKMTRAGGKGSVRCWEHFEAADHPCTWCPLFGGGTGGGRTGGLIDRGIGPLQLVAVERHGARANVLISDLPDNLAGDLARLRAMRVLRDSPLSAQQHKVVALVMASRTGPEIAAVLGITPRTVKYHLAQALRKLGVASRRALLEPLLLPASHLPPE